MKRIGKDFQSLNRFDIPGAVKIIDRETLYRIFHVPPPLRIFFKIFAIRDSLTYVRWIYGVTQNAEERTKNRKKK